MVLIGNMMESQGLPTVMVLLYSSFHTSIFFIFFLFFFLKDVSHLFLLYHSLSISSISIVSYM